MVMSCGIQEQVTNMVNESDNCPESNLSVAVLFFLLSVCVI